MKKHLMIFGIVIGVGCLITVVASAKSAQKEVSEVMAAKTADIGFASLLTNHAPVDFQYQVGSRFIATITKEQLQRAETVEQIIPKGADWPTQSLRSIMVKNLATDEVITRETTEMTLSDAQLALLRTADYSDNFQILAKYGDLDIRYDQTYFMTIVPETEASYSNGKEALIQYLQKKSAVEIRNVTEGRLTPGKIKFTVTANGAITNVKLTESSSYESIDKLMIELVSQIPGSWIPATNSKGEKIDQEFMYSFGKIGC